MKVIYTLHKYMFPIATISYLSQKLCAHSLMLLFVAKENI